VVDVSRVTRTKAEARANYDRRSRGYERVEGRFERRARLAGEQALAVGVGEDVLEVGSGPGESLATFARRSGPDGRVIGVDLSTAMHRVATARLRSTGLAGTVSLVTADGASLPLRAGCVDAAFMSFTLELFDTPEIPTVLGECRRVLRRGGRLVVVGMSKAGSPDRLINVFEWAHKHFPQFLDCRPIYVRRALEEAGFSIREALTRHMWVPVEIVLGISGAEADR
jgi:ubiquinone/menaquinone biosynthesis C-methylase UbiE